MTWFFCIGFLWNIKIRIKFCISLFDKSLCQTEVLRNPSSSWVSTKSWAESSRSTIEIVSAGTMMSHLRHSKFIDLLRRFTSAACNLQSEVTSGIQTKGYPELLLKCTWLANQTNRTRNNSTTCQSITCYLPWSRLWDNRWSCCTNFEIFLDTSRERFSWKFGLCSGMTTENSTINNF